MNDSDMSNPTNPLSETVDEQEDAPEAKSEGAGDSHDGYCPPIFYGQRDTHHFVDQQRGDLIKLSPLISAAIDIASQKGAPPLPIPDSLLEYFRSHVSAGELNADDEGCWRFGVRLALLSIVREIAEAAEVLDLQFIPPDLPN
jgi:hypothetical protein